MADRKDLFDLWATYQTIKISAITRTEAAATTATVPASGDSAAGAAAVGSRDRPRRRDNGDRAGE